MLFGGTNIKKDLNAFRRLNFPDILVGTPGRINDLLQNHGLQEAMGGLQCFILDEADQLLDMGFRPDLNRMLRMLPPKNTRQTLLFSATMPKDIMNMSNFALRDEFLHIDTVGKEDQDTHKRIPQFVTVHPYEQHFSQLMHAIEEGKQVKDYKIIVFFVTARLTQLNAEVFNLMGYNVLEIHSRKSQHRRTTISRKFRERRSGILFTSDVSARGMDYPGVTHVIQVGAPSSKAQYVHRIGRTGRAGKGGKGILLLSSQEQTFLKQCKDLPIKERPGAPETEVDNYNQHVVFPALKQIDIQVATNASLSLFGYYNTHLKPLGWRKESLLENITAFSEDVLHRKFPTDSHIVRRIFGGRGMGERRKKKHNRGKRDSVARGKEPGNSPTKKGGRGGKRNRYNKKRRRSEEWE